MKKYILFTLSVIALILVSISLYTLLNEEEKPINEVDKKLVNVSQKSVSNEQTTKLSQRLKIYLPDTTNFYELDLVTYLDNKLLFTQEKRAENVWTIKNDEFLFEITASSTDSSPFSSKTEPEVKTITSDISKKPIYKINSGGNIYFYTDSYYLDSCGDNFCSNGIISIDEDIFISVICDGTTQSICDQLINNLIINKSE